MSSRFNHVSVIARMSIFSLLTISANEAALFFIDLAFNVANLTLSVLQVLGPGLGLRHKQAATGWLALKMVEILM